MNERSLRAQVAALEQLLQVHERVALEKTNQLEEALRQRDEALARADAEGQRLNSILMQLPLAMAMYEGPDFVLALANPALFAMISVDESAIGKRLVDLLPEIQAQGYVDLFRQVYETGAPYYATEAPVTLEEPGGPSLRYFDFALLAQRDTAEMPRAILAIAYDVTEKVENRRRLETLNSELMALADFSHAINAATRIDDVLSLAAAAARSLLGAGACAVRLWRPDGETHTTLAADPPEAAARLERDDVLRRARRVVKTRAPLRVARDDLLAGEGTAAAGRSMMAWIGAPLEGHDKSVVGTIEGVEKEDGFGQEDEVVLTELARVTSIALENVRSYQRERRIAETLQRTLLPEIPVLPQLDVGVRYIAGAVGSQIGGDWYDAVVLDGDRVALVLGDVAGKGTHAAAVMGQVRIALRVFALEQSTPAHVVECLDAFVQRVLPVDMATLVYVEAAPRLQTLSYVNAGHLPPLLVAPGGEATYLTGASSIPIGVGKIERVSEEVRFAPGSVLLLYSDGLVERRHAEIDEGLSRLRRIAEAPFQDLEELIEAIVAGLLPPEGSDDDVAILAVRMTAETVPAGG